MSILAITSLRRDLNEFRIPRTARIARKLYKKDSRTYLRANFVWPGTGFVDAVNLSCSIGSRSIDSI